MNFTCNMWVFLVVSLEEAFKSHGVALKDFVVKGIFLKVVG